MLTNLYIFSYLINPYDLFFTYKKTKKNLHITSSDFRGRKNRLHKSLNHTKKWWSLGTYDSIIPGQKSPLSESNIFAKWKAIHSDIDVYTC